MIIIKIIILRQLFTINIGYLTITKAKHRYLLKIAMRSIIILINFLCAPKNNLTCKTGR